MTRSLHAMLCGSQLKLCVSRLTFLGLLILSIAACQTALAQRYLDWGPSYLYDHYNNFGQGGIGTPSVSLFGSTVVEVHDGGNGTLWYHVGAVSGGKVNWYSALQYDHYNNFGHGGIGTPSVSLFGSTVVEVHDGGNGTLWYHVGIVSGGKVNWYSAFQYDHYNNFGQGGIGTPSVSLYGNIVVEAHSGGNGTLWYRVGAVSGSQIAWYTDLQYDNGFNPSISISAEQIIVEVHDGASGQMWYRTGVANGELIFWDTDNALQYDQYYMGGGTPSVSVYNWNVVEVHDGGETGKLWYHVGWVK